MKVSENVEKGGAVLKMVSSSTGLLKGMMELSLAAGVSNTTSSTVGNVNGGSTASPDDNDTTPQPRPANCPSSIQSPVVGGGDRAALRRLGKGLAWLRGRRRRHGAPPSSGDQANRCRQHGDHRSATTNATTHVCPTTESDCLPTSVNIVDNSNGRQDAAVGGVYEKRAKWLTRCSRVSDLEECRANVKGENGTTASGFSSDAEKPNVAISVISDGGSNTADGPSKVNSGFVAGSIDGDAKPNDHSGGGQTEVVLDPTGLSTTKAGVVAGDRSHDHQMSVAVDYVPSTTTVLQPRDSDADYRVEDNVHVVTAKRPRSIVLGPVTSPAADHAEHSQPSSLSSDLDSVCSEIGRLVADYMRQHLVSFVRLNYVLNHDYNQLNTSKCCRNGRQDAALHFFPPQ